MCRSSQLCMTRALMFQKYPAECIAIKLQVLHLRYAATSCLCWLGLISNIQFGILIVAIP
uniref:Uncharacterized protein n=1 Tax=Octopus bimaculoides TaxID=37653 RepID=A0A0L8G1K4_OCTBM